MKRRIKESRRLCARLIVAACERRLNTHAAPPALLASHMRVFIPPEPPPLLPQAGPQLSGGPSLQFAVVCHHLLFLTNSTPLPRHPTVTPSTPPPTGISFSVMNYSTTLCSNTSAQNSAVAVVNYLIPSDINIVVCCCCIMDGGFVCEM